MLLNLEINYIFILVLKYNYYVCFKLWIFGNDMYKKKFDIMYDVMVMNGRDVLFINKVFLKYIIFIKFWCMDFNDIWWMNFLYLWWWILISFILMSILMFWSSFGNISFFGILFFY